MEKKTNKLPKKYVVGGQQMNIKEVGQIEDGKLGNCCVAEGIINIAKQFGSQIQSHTSKLNTVWHEIVHSILDTMGETELSRNEKFVCTFSGFLTEVLTTLK